MDDFNRQKIIWGELSDKPKFALDKQGNFVIANTVFMMTGKHLEYLLAILNSKLSEYYFSQIATTSGVGTVRWLKYKIELLPIPKIEKVPYHLLEKLISLLQHPLENDEEINRIIYYIYGISSAESEVISKFCSK